MGNGSPPAAIPAAARVLPLGAALQLRRALRGQQTIDLRNRPAEAHFLHEQTLGKSSGFAGATQPLPLQSGQGGGGGGGSKT